MLLYLGLNLMCEIKARINQALETTGKNPSQLAKIMGKKASGVYEQLGNLEKETNNLSMVICTHKLTGVSLDWLLKGDGEMFPIPNTTTAQQLEKIVEQKVKERWIKGLRNGDD